MELVADDIEGMSKLAKALGKSKSKNEEDDAKLRAFLDEVRVTSSSPTCLFLIISGVGHGQHYHSRAPRSGNWSFKVGKCRHLGTRWRCLPTLEPEPGSGGCG